MTQNAAPVESPEQTRERIRLAAEAKARAERRRAISLLPVSPDLTRKDLAEVAAAEKKGEGVTPALRAIANRAKQRTEDTEVYLGVTEQMAMATGAGIEAAQQKGQRFKPAQRLDGLAWLLRKGQDSKNKSGITQQQHDAGRRYQKLYEMLETGDLKSCLNILEVRGSIQLAPGQAKAVARSELDKARKALAEHPGMVTAMDLICGEGFKPSEAYAERRDYERLESQLDCALSVLVRVWGMA